MQRVVYLDYIRVLACILILFIHSPNKQINIWVSIYNYITVPGIGLFFMVSGALLFPVHEPLDIFLRKRLSKIVFPLIFWSLFYITIKLIWGEMKLTELPGSLLEILYTSSASGILWFLYTLIGLYFFIPIISKWLEYAKQQELLYFLGLWGITLTLSYLQIKTSLFSCFYGYMGYMILGYYLSKHPLKLNYILMGIITLVVSGILPMLFYFNILSGVENNMLYNYLTINVAWLCILYYTLLQRWNFKNHKIVNQLSIMSFGIYLIHIFIIRRVVWLWLENCNNNLPTSIQVPLTALITLIISFTIIKLISLLRFSKYIIGV